MTSIKTHGIKYMGSKLRLLPQLQTIFARLQPKTALDVFTGTTRVAQMLRGMDVMVTTSDVSEYSRVFSGAWVCGGCDMKNVEFHASRLDRKSGYRGWFTDTYCDVQGKKGGLVRFMTPENGMRVDCIRDSIAALNTAGDITNSDADMLIATLIMAMDRVDNTVGIQQAYLKDWCTRSKTKLRMQTYSAPMGPQGNHIVGDVLEVKLPSADIAYLDPPYTEHAYGSYYHIWDSIAKWDKPDVDLKTNRRIDKCYGNAVMPWNRKAEAPDAFRRLLSRLDVGRVVISYAKGSVISLEELADIVAESHNVEKIDTIVLNENIMAKIGNGENTQQIPGRLEWIIEATPRS